MRTDFEKIRQSVIVDVCHKYYGTFSRLCWTNYQQMSTLFLSFSCCGTLMPCDSDIALHLPVRILPPFRPSSSTGRQEKDPDPTLLYNIPASCYSDLFMLRPMHF